MLVPAHHHTTLSMTPHPPLELGPNNDHVVWAPGEFFYMFFASYLIQLTYIFHFLQVLNETTPGQWQPLTGPQKHPQPPP